MFAAKKWQCHLGEEIGDHDVYTCECGTYITHMGTIVSKSFRGRTGTAYLFGEALNLTEGPDVQRQLTSGIHVVRDVACKDCGKHVGWTYKEAYGEQRYKIGCFCLELALIKLDHTFQVPLPATVEPELPVTPPSEEVPATAEEEEEERAVVQEEQDVDGEDDGEDEDEEDEDGEDEDEDTGDPPISEGEEEEEDESEGYVEDDANPQASLTASVASNVDGWDLLDPVILGDATTSQTFSASGGKGKNGRTPKSNRSELESAAKDNAVDEWEEVESPMLQGLSDVTSTQQKTAWILVDS